MSQSSRNREGVLWCCLLAWAAVVLFVPMAIAAEDAAEPTHSIYVGDTVVTIDHDVELGLRDKPAAVLDAGSELRVTEVRGAWIGGYAVVDGQRYTGWVHRRDVRLGGSDPGDVARVEVPDLPDDSEAVAALKERGVDVVLNAAGNVALADATQSELEDADLVHFQELHQLSYLDLSDRPLSDDGLQMLPLSPALQELYLNDTQVTDAVLDHLAGLINLEILTLANTNVTGAGLATLTQLRHLNVVNLDGCDVGDDDLRVLEDMPQLEVLVLAHTGVSSNGVVHLAPVERLRVLNLNGCEIDDMGLLNLRPLENLRMLHVEDTQVTDEGILALNEAAPSLAIFD